MIWIYKYFDWNRVIITSEIIFNYKKWIIKTEAKDEVIEKRNKNIKLKLGGRLRIGGV